ERLDDQAPDQQQGHTYQYILQQLHGVFQVYRVLPYWRRRRRIVAELAIDDAQRVAARGAVTHGLLDQIVQLGQFVFGQRRGLAVDIAIIHHHRHGQPAQRTHRVLHVADSAVDLVVDGGVTAAVAAALLQVATAGEHVGILPIVARVGGGIGIGGVLIGRILIVACRGRRQDGGCRVQGWLIGQRTGYAFGRQDIVLHG